MKEDFPVLCPVQALSKMMAIIQQSLRRWLSQRTHKHTWTDVQLASKAQMSLQAALVSKTSASQWVHYPCSPSPWPRFQGSAAAERAAESSACGSGASPLTCPSFYLLQGWIIIPLHFTHRSLNIKRKRKKQRKKKQQTEQISRELRNTSQ